MPSRSKPRVVTVGAWMAAAFFAGCAWTDAPATTLPAIAPPIGVAAHTLGRGPDQHLLTLYRDRATFGIYEHDEGWDTTARYVQLEAPASTVAPVSDPARGVAFVVAYPTLGSVATVRIQGEEDHATSHTVLTGPPGQSELLVADLNGDGLQDLVVASAGPRRQLRLALGVTDGTPATLGAFGPPRSLPLSPTTRRVPSLQAADLNLDGVPDIVCGMPTGSGDDPVPDQVRLFRGTHRGYLRDETWYRVEDPARLSVGRVDSDAWPDVVAFGERGVWILYGQGAGWLGEASRVIGGDFSSGALVDVDADGRDDIVALHRGRNRAVVVRASGPRAFAPPRVVRVGDGPVAMTIATVAGSQILVTANQGSNDFSLIELSSAQPQRSEPRHTGTAR